MVTTIRYYPQNHVALISRSLGDISQRLIAAQAHAQDFAGTHALEPQLSAHEGHRAHLAGDIDALVGDGGSHPANYTPTAGRCRVRWYA